MPRMATATLVARVLQGHMKLQPTVLVEILSICGSTDHCAKCDSITCHTYAIGYLLYSNDGKCYPSNACPSKTYADSTNCIGETTK